MMATFISISHPASVCGAVKVDVRCSEVHIRLISTTEDFQNVGTSGCFFFLLKAKHFSWAQILNISF